MLLTLLFKFALKLMGRELSFRFKFVMLSLLISVSYLFVPVYAISFI